VALVQSLGYVYRSCAVLLAKAVGRQVLPGADTPLIESSVFCAAPVRWLCLCVWLRVVLVASVSELSSLHC
jgi:hypothetical protein